MPTYTYKAKKGPAEIVEGQIEAESQDQAVSKLEGLGLVPVRVVELVSRLTGERVPSLRAKRSNLNAGIASAASRPRNDREMPSAPRNDITVKARDLDIFTRQLSSLVRASVPILRALSLICRQAEDKALKSLVADLERQVKEGRVLSEAMESYPNIFNNLYLSIVKSGERGGALDEALLRLTAHREKGREMRQKVQAAMAYPVLLIVVGVGTVFVMLTCFLPKLMVLFKNMKQTLPLPTRALIGVSDFMTANWFWFLIALMLLAVVFSRVRAGSKKKFLFDAFKLRVPFVKKFVRDVEIVKFCRTLGLLLKNGIPVYESLELATNTLDNEVLRGFLRTANREIVAQGSTLSESLAKTGIFPAFVLNMVTVGEEGGRLEESLSEVAETYEREFEQAIKLMSALLEPLLILVVGAVVGFIVFAMLLPIFDIGVIGR